MKLLYCFLKDMRLSLKSFYFYIEIGMSLIFAAIILFIIPENFNTGMIIYTYMESGIPIVQESVANDNNRIIFLDSKDSVLEQIKEHQGSVGLLIYGQDDKMVYEYVLQGYEDPKIKNLLEVSVKTELIARIQGYQSVTERVILDQDAERLSHRLNLIPVFIALNVGFMGLFIIASYIFLDKQEGVIKALMVTPAGIWHYLLGKVGVLAISGLVSGWITVLLTAGDRVHFLHFTLHLVACNLFGSALGLFIASFFNTMAKAMGWMYVAIIILALAAVSYYNPSFSPLVIKLLPSYPMLFAFRETLLTQPDTTIIYLSVAGYLMAAIVFFLISCRHFKKTLTV